MDIKPPHINNTLILQSLTTGYTRIKALIMGIKNINQRNTQI